MSYPTPTRVALRAVVIALAISVAPVSRAAAQGPVDDILKSATSALDTWRYREADSLARVALSFGNMLSKKQQALALQISIAAVYPEDKPTERLADSAMARIKRLLAFDKTAWDRNLTWDGLDSLHAYIVRATRPGKLLIGSRSPGAILFVNDAAQGPVGSLRTIELSPDVPSKISIKAEKCISWDTLVVVRAADSVTVGRKNLTCTP